jgi:hypothetical protein
MTVDVITAVGITVDVIIAETIESQEKIKKIKLKASIVVEAFLY